LGLQATGAFGLCAALGGNLANKCQAYSWSNAGGESRYVGC